MTMRQTLALLALLTVTAGEACAAEATGGDAEAGHALALKVCTACHVAAADQPDPPILRPAAPPFRSIANRPSTTEAFLVSFIATTHSTMKAPNQMPNPQLTDEQVKNVAAYILTLKKH